MYCNQKILAVIPARGGSKGIPHKNIKPLAGHPLIAYSICAARESRYVDRVIVSTDDKDIKDVALKYGADVPFLRPEKLSSDTAKTIDALIHAIDTLKESGEEYDMLLLLQPTQPIRTGEMIDDAIETLMQSSEDSLVSVCAVEEHPILMRTIKNGSLCPILQMSSTVRRQDFPDVYKVNGSIYLNRINDNFDANTSLNDNVLPFIMDRALSIDIDTPKDFMAAEEFLGDHDEFRISIRLQES